MTDYAFRSYEQRQKIREMAEATLSAREIAASLAISPSAVDAELRRGRDGTRLPGKRLGYHAEPAQLGVQQSLERRERWTAGACHPPPTEYRGGKHSEQQQRHRA